MRDSIVSALTMLVDLKSCRDIDPGLKVKPAWRRALEALRRGFF
jgi:hypothetical protein